MGRSNSTIKKRCSKCRNYKDFSDFGKNRNAKDGLRYKCKECEQLYSRKYYRVNKQSVRKRYSYNESHRLVKGVEQKRCPKCKKWKDYGDFAVNPDSKDGLRCQCKECERKYSYKYSRRDGKPHRSYRYVRHRVRNGVKEKRCSKCTKWKAEDQFYRCHRCKDGLASQCKECNWKAVQKSRKRRAAVKD